MENFSLKQTRLISELSSILYNFLPGSGAIYTFADAAQEIGEEDFWIGGSKLPAIQHLLEKVFMNAREKFPPLIKLVIKEGIKYRDKKGNPITSQEIKDINKILGNLDIRIEELQDNDFLLSLGLALSPKKEKSKYEKLFDQLKLHPKVIESSRSLFINGHYAEAIFEAYKALNIYVKTKSCKRDLDGQALMSTVFSEQRPILKINKLSNQSEIDEQAGFKFIYMGAMRGIRNPKAHERIIQTDPIRSLKYLSLASLLIEIAEESKKVIEQFNNGLKKSRSD